MAQPKKKRMGFWKMTFAIAAGFGLVWFIGQVFAEETYIVGQGAPPSRDWPTLTVDYNNTRTHAPNFLIVSVTNNAKESYTTSPYDFELKDGDGAVYDLKDGRWHGDHGGFYIPTTLQPRDTAEGELYFDNDGTYPPYSLIYEHKWGKTVLPLQI